MKNGEKIKLTTLMAGPDGVHQPGAVLTIGGSVSLERAKALMKAKSAHAHVGSKEKSEDAPEAITAKQINKMNKKQLLATCASSDFEINPPDGATNQKLKDLLIGKLEGKPDEVPEATTGGSTEPGAPIDEKQLRLMDPDSLKKLCNDPQYSIELADDATAIDMVDLLLEAMATK